MRRYREKSVEDEALYVVELFSLEMISMLQWLRLQSIAPPSNADNGSSATSTGSVACSILIKALSMTREKSLYLGMGKNFFQWLITIIQEKLLKLGSSFLFEMISLIV